jgi:class 3 adenylate cyclase
VVESPEIHYARNGSIHVAYQTLGTSSDRDLLIFSSAVLPIDSMDDEPGLARFHRRLSRFARVIRFDARGVGMSDPIDPDGSTTLEHWVEDAVSVLDAAGSRRAAVLAPRDSSMQGVLLAASFPQRVSALVLINGTARFARADDYPAGIPQVILDRFLDLNMDPDAVEKGLDYLSLAAPTAAADPSFRAWWVKAGYRGASPSAARMIQSVWLRADVRPVLPFVRVPSLIIHRRDNDAIRVGHGRYLAEHIPGARLVELDGADDLYWVGDTDEMLAEIEEFLTGERTANDPDVVLATVLFTDIVGSTGRMAEIGERAWSTLLDRHDAAIRRQLGRFGGTEVKTTGDGLVATFTGPAQAVRCAQAIRDAAGQIGLEVRVGVHTGQIENRGVDIGGMAVHIAARVQAAARPGEILVTRTVVDIAVGSGIEFEPRGQRVLKGVPGRWPLFSIRQA